MNVKGSLFIAGECSQEDDGIKIAARLITDQTAECCAIATIDQKVDRLQDDLRSKRGQFTSQGCCRPCSFKGAKTGGAT